MFLLLLVLLVALPLAELYVIFQVGHRIGALETLALLVVVSIVGAWLVRRQGMGVLQRMQRQAMSGQVPTRELVDGALLLVAGVLMLTPGFLTDVVGLALVIPPVRAAVRAALLARYRRRKPGTGQGRVWRRVVIDVDGDEHRGRRPPGGGELEP